MMDQTLSKPENVEQLDAESGCPAPLCSRLVPYYDHAGVTIYHGDAAEIVPQLGRFDLLLTDPPYGIGRDKGNASGKDGSGFYAHALRKEYPDSWDIRPSAEVMRTLIGAAKLAMVWGGNYFAHELPQSSFWLVWDKENTMPTFSDCELAWTNSPRKSVKRLTYSGNGLMGKETKREHPTQKPVALMQWCIGLAGDVETILDPFAGSGTTGRAAKDLGKRAVLIEREEKYCEIAATRMSQEVLPLYCENASVEAPSK